MQLKPLQIELFSRRYITKITYDRTKHAVDYSIHHLNVVYLYFVALPYPAQLYSNRDIMTKERTDASGAAPDFQRGV